jgi:hypothetical protein
MIIDNSMAMLKAVFLKKILYFDPNNNGKQHNIQNIYWIFCG